MDHNKLWCEKKTSMIFSYQVTQVLVEQQKGNFHPNIILCLLLVKINPQSLLSLLNCQFQCLRQSFYCPLHMFFSWYNQKCCDCFCCHLLQHDCKLNLPAVKKQFAVLLWRFSSCTLTLTITNTHLHTQIHAQISRES